MRGCDSWKLANQTSADDIFVGGEQSQSYFLNFFMVSGVYELGALEEHHFLLLLIADIFGAIAASSKILVLV